MGASAYRRKARGARNGACARRVHLANPQHQEPFMADEEERSFSPSTTQVNRGRMQGLGVGQTEIDGQRDPTRQEHANNPQRLEPYHDEIHEATNSDRPSQADFTGQDVGQDVGEDGGAMSDEAEGQPQAAQVRRDGWGLDPNLGRNEAGIEHAGDLGAGTPANVDIHNLGMDDKPQEDWGEPGDEGMVFSSNRTNRGGRTELERGQGAKTRGHNKDTVSRRT
jgi:hypothetical protein